MNDIAAFTLFLVACASEPPPAPPPPRGSPASATAPPATAVPSAPPPVPSAPPPVASAEPAEDDDWVFFPECLKNLAAPSPFLLGGCPVQYGGEPHQRIVRQTIPLAAFLRDAPKLVGELVTVTGPLRRARPSCTKMKCAPNTCCNRCTSDMVLSGVADPPASSPNAVALHGTFMKTRIRCRGDESAQACVFDPNGAVIEATGTVEASGGRYALANVDLCTPM